MTTVFFVRHAQSAYNEDGRMAGLHDPPLSDVGVKQAGCLARYLEQAHWDAVYASPLRRAQDTARIVVGTRALRVVTDPSICELDVGGFSGCRWQDVVNDYPRKDGKEVTFWELFSRDNIPGQEPYRSSVSRVMSFFDRVAAAQDGQTVLVVSHKGVMEVFLSETIGFDPRIDWFDISAGSVTTFELAREGRTRFLSINVRPG